LLAGEGKVSKGGNRIVKVEVGGISVQAHPLSTKVENPLNSRLIDFSIQNIAIMHLRRVSTGQSSDTNLLKVTRAWTLESPLVRETKDSRHVS